MTTVQTRNRFQSRTRHNRIVHHASHYGPGYGSHLRGRSKAKHRHASVDILKDVVCVIGIITVCFSLCAFYICVMNHWRTQDEERKQKLQARERQGKRRLIKVNYSTNSSYRRCLLAPNDHQALTQTHTTTATTITSKTTAATNITSMAAVANPRSMKTEKLSFQENVTKNKKELLQDETKIHVKTKNVQNLCNS